MKLASNLGRSMSRAMVYKGVSMVLSLVYVPIVLNYLGDYKYGVWASILSILSWISYFDLGIGNGLRNRLSEAIASDSPRVSPKALVSSAYAILSGVVAVVAAVCGIAIAFVDWPALLSAWEVDESLLCVVELSFLGMCFSFVLTLCNSVYYALQRAQVVNLISVCQQAVMLLSVWLLSLTDSRSLTAVAVFYVASNILVYGVFTIYVFARNRELAPSPRSCSRAVAKDVGGLGIMFFITQIATLVLFTTDNLIVSNLFGPEQVTVYTTANKAFTVLSSLFAALVVPLWSKTTVDYARGDIAEIRRTLGKMHRLFAIAVAGVIVMVLVFKPLVRVWLGRDLGFDDSLIALMGVYAIVYMWNTIYSQVINGLTLVNFMVAVACVQAVLNIPLSVFLATSCGLGVNGVLLGTIAAMLISSVTYPGYSKKVLDRAEASDHGAE